MKSTARLSGEHSDCRGGYGSPCLIDVSLMCLGLVSVFRNFFLTTPQVFTHSQRHAPQEDHPPHLLCFLARPICYIDAVLSLGGLSAALHPNLEAICTCSGSNLRHFRSFLH